MTDFATARRMMVDGQVRTADVTDLRILAAMQEVPRERFVPQASAALAYLDLDLPVGAGRCLIKPMVLGKLLQEADIKATDRVLDVGCATGYAAAILARLAANVVALEQDAALAQAAKSALSGMPNVTVMTGPLADGWRQGAPYDVILLEGTTEVTPKALCGQLSDGGRLLCIQGRAPATKATLYVRSGADTGARPIFDAAAPVLPGFVKPPAFAF
jgi:protein-L-isoaspartate(D-aspartate) O-methyltransferase